MPGYENCYWVPGKPHVHQDSLLRTILFSCGLLRCLPLLFFISIFENSIWRELPDVVRWLSGKLQESSCPLHKCWDVRHIPTCLALYLAFSVGIQAQFFLFAQQASSDFVLFLTKNTGHQDVLFTYQPHHHIPHCMPCNF